MKTQIKLIIFDAYGVCLNEGYPNTSKYLAKKYKMNWHQVQNILYTKYFNLAAVKQISQNEAWEKAIKELKLPLTTDQLKKIHFGLMRLNPKILNLANQLKKNFKITLLSKNTRQQFKITKQKFPELEKIFGKNTINTWEHNLPKASEKTVNFLSNKFKVSPKEMLYIDDQEINLAIPKKLGVKTIFYKNFKQVQTEIQKYLK